jgi:hypothetical protein
MPKIITHKGAFWRYGESKIISRITATNGALQVIDNSRASPRLFRVEALNNQTIPIF